MTGLNVDGARPAFVWATSLPADWTTSNERLVLVVLAADSFRGGLSAPGEADLMQWTGLPRSSLYAALKSLEAPTPTRPALLERCDKHGNPLGGRRPGRARVHYRLLAQTSDSQTSSDQTSSDQTFVEVQEVSSSQTSTDRSGPVEVQEVSSSQTCPTPSPKEPSPLPPATSADAQAQEVEEVAMAITNIWPNIGRRDMHGLKAKIRGALGEIDKPDLIGHLTSNPETVRSPTAILNSRLDNLPHRSRAKPSTGPSCDRCGYPETTCRRVQVKNKDPHAFIPSTATMARSA